MGVDQAGQNHRLSEILDLVSGPSWRSLQRPTQATRPADMATAPLSIGGLDTGTTMRARNNMNGEVLNS